MGRVGKVGLKLGNTWRRIRSKDQGSDESDEDFTIGEDEEYESDEYCSSLDPDELEEGLGEFELEEEEEEVKMKVNRAVRPNTRKSVPVKRGKGIKKLQKKKRKRFTYKQDEDDDDTDDDNDVEFMPDEIDYIDDEDEKPVMKKKRASYKQEDDGDYDDGGGNDGHDDGGGDDGGGGGGDDGHDDDGGEDDDGGDNDDGDYDGGDDEDEDEDEDEEFTLDGIDFVDEEDDMPAPKKNKKVSKPRSRETGLAIGRKRIRNSEIMKKPTSTWKKPRTNRRLVKKTSSGSVAIPRSVGKTSSGSDGDFANKSLVVEERHKKIPGRRRRRFIAVSDSDFMNSGPSDYEYTISEEEREQVREANKFCTSLSTSLRSSSLSKKFKEKEETCKQKKNPVRKGKEKVEDLKKQVVKQVCGICLSEEGNRTVQGTLNCCSHYFCFACIMEWSKVESRCPLCKQRFVTISKPARSDSGFDLRTVAIQVPERDQVYQPSEEELRGYLDPYDGVICTECQQGGDDALMLLCDICDSPAHTYCVGLGCEVPEGNWYCEGCRPAACGALNSHGINYTPDQRASNNLSGLSSPVHNVGELDLNSLYVPDTPLTQETGGFPFSRRFVGDFSAASPTSGSGAFTVFERRRIQRQIQHLLHSRRNPSGSQSNGIPSTNSGIRLFGSQIDRGTELAFQQTMTPERRASQYTSSQGRLQDVTTTLLPSRDAFSSRSSQLIEQGQNPFSTSIDGILQAERSGISMAFNSFNSRLNYEQLHPCSSRSNVDSAGQSSYAFRETRIPSRTSQGALHKPF